MKGILILALVLLAGCGTYTPLEQLEANALVSGDWSAVEQRERLISRRQASHGPQCQNNEFSLCQGTGRNAICECAELRVLRSFLDGDSY